MMNETERQLERVIERLDRIAELLERIAERPAVINYSITSEPLQPGPVMSAFEIMRALGGAT